MLTAGLVLIGIGAALLVSLNIGRLSYWFVMPAALIFLFTGIALTISYYLPRRK